ncbi:MAG TPA: plastocyanin/azurin family copper-binding protein [Nitrososphaeraceae archaeon]|nr:plastocyanin/azurin family copper-binding protein [Nitrososphaeraceae archaeon]
MSNSEKGLPEKSVKNFQKIKDYGLPLTIMAISLLIVFIFWASFGHIGPTFSNDVLTNQQDTLRAKYKLPPLEKETGEASEIPPSLRNIAKSNTTTKSSDIQPNQTSGGIENTTQSTTNNTTSNSGTSDNATSPGSVKQEQQAVGESTNTLMITILEGSSIQGNPSYDPDELTVKKGGKITVDNVDTMPHTVTNGESATDQNSAKLFDTSIINGGETAEIDTSSINAGKYPYYCMVHPYMKGILTIE